MISAMYWIVMYLVFSGITGSNTITDNTDFSGNISAIRSGDTGDIGWQDSLTFIASFFVFATFGISFNFSIPLLLQPVFTSITLFFSFITILAITSLIPGVGS